MRIPLNVFSTQKRAYSSLEEEWDERVRRSLKKMESFLEERNMVDSFREIKRKCRIDIKGRAENGKERKIIGDLIEQYGVDELEDSKAFNTIFPPVNSGVIVNHTKDVVYYSYFEVTSETDEVFEMYVYDYCFTHGVFFLRLIVKFGDLNKELPLSECKTGWKVIKDFFIDDHNIYDNVEFSKEDIDNVLIFSDGTEESEVDVLFSSVLSVFQTVNFLKEKFSDDYNKYLDNDYFQLINWFEGGADSLSLIQNPVKDVIDEILDTDTALKLVQTKSLSDIINGVIQKGDIQEFYVAVGFAFQSGLHILEPSFDSVKKRKGKCQLTIGSLQHFKEEGAINRMDRATAGYLNNLINEKGVHLFTLSSCFYHGKFYYLANEKKAYVVVGSSNISKTAYSSNYELDVIHIIERDSEQDKMFLNWYNQLVDECEAIDQLEESSFRDFNWDSELDAFQSINNRKVSREETQKRIDTLTDEELKFRLNMWMSKKPTDIYDDLDIESLLGYSMFVFASNHLVVFESFAPGNAYYVFRYRNNLIDLVRDLSNRSKTQMKVSEHYVNRGYHIQSRERIKNRIDAYFNK